MNYIVVLIAVLHVSFVSFSQEIQKDSVSTNRSLKPPSNVFLGFGSGTTKNYVLDKQVSPLIYSGLGSGGYTSVLVRRPKKISRFDIHVSTTSLSNKTQDEDDEASSAAFGLKYNTGKYYFARNMFHEKGKLFLGYCSNFQVNVRANPRFLNSGFNYDIFYNAGPAAHLEREFSWKEKRFKIWFLKIHRKERSLRLAWQVELPLFTLITRPNYTAIIHGPDSDAGEAVVNTVVDNLDLASMLTFPMVTSRLELYYRLHNNNNMLRLAYIWQGYSYNKKYYEVQSVVSGLFFSYIFKLDKNSNY